MRLFIGVWLSPAMRDEVTAFINRHRPGLFGLRWVQPENLHFTLKFLGEAPPSRLKTLETALIAAGTEMDPFTLTLGLLGAFPSVRSPRVLWIGVSQGAENLRLLAATVEESCLTAGFLASDKPFQPHLTIARVGKDHPAPQLPQFHVSFETQTPVSGFALIESDLRPSGPVYRTIKEFPLKKTVC